MVVGCQGNAPPLRPAGRHFAAVTLLRPAAPSACPRVARRNSSHSRRADHAVGRPWSIATCAFPAQVPGAAAAIILPAWGGLGTPNLAHWAISVGRSRPHQQPLPNFTPAISTGSTTGLVAWPTNMDREFKRLSMRVRRVVCVCVCGGVCARTHRRGGSDVYVVCVC